MARVLLATLALTLAGAAAAQPADEEEPAPEEDEGYVRPREPLADRALMLRVGGSYSLDSNFFRSPTPREERIATAYVGLSLDKAYAQQRFRLDITETAYRYDNFSHLDFEGLNYAGAWTWKFTPRIGGALSATRAESLADYGEFRQPGTLNVRTTENFLASADAELFGGWHLTGGLRSEKNRYSVPFPQEGSYRANGGEAGVRWVASSSNWLAFNLRSLDGRYVDRALDPVAKVDDGFRRNELEALGTWHFTGKSSLEGRAAWIDYQSDHFAERDFSGLAAKLRYLWSLTGKLSLFAQASQEIEPWSETRASYRVEQRVSLGPVWQPLARTTLRLEAAHTENDFRGPLPGFTGTLRHDKLNGLHFDAEWRALRNLSLKATVFSYRQSSSDPIQNYDGNVVTFGASLLL